MINAYKNGKDLYATIAEVIYKNKYEDNLEFHPDGTLNPEGKKRRSGCKSVLLGIMYGRGVNSIAEQINGTIQDAQAIIDKFFESFPKVKIWMDDTLSNAHKLGYVEDFYGRRRRLPNILLPKYSVEQKIDGDKELANFNPFFGCSDFVDTKLQKNIKKYKEKLDKAKYRKEINKITEEALRDGIIVRDNTSYISRNERQCVNARIQGGASTMTKIAMIKIHNDEILKALDFKLLIGVHDELIGECPKENQDKVADRLTYIMKTCIADRAEVPFKCDADICDHWYFNEYVSIIKEEYEKLLKEGLTKEQANDIIIENHSESLKEDLMSIINSD